MVVLMITLVSEQQLAAVRLFMFQDRQAGSDMLSQFFFQGSRQCCAC